MKRRKICVVSGSRADYGHLVSVMHAICTDPRLSLQIAVTGSHLLADQGHTWRMIERDGFRINARIDIGDADDSGVGIARRIGMGCARFAKAFRDLRPDIVVVLGDRYEILAATIAAYVMRIPVAHLHGGEASEGVLDEGFRHAMTKLSQWHFVATEGYRRRVIQLGEQPSRVFNVGAPGLDALRSMRYLSRAELAKDLKWDLGGRVAIVTYHPETLEKTSAPEQLSGLLAAIRRTEVKVLFTKANADAQGRKINDVLARFCRRNPKRYKLVDNLGPVKYWSCLKCFDLMIGNSSSGIIEAPSFGLPVVNIGARQQGRIRARNVIDVGASAGQIQRGITTALSKRFRNGMTGLKNPYCRYCDGRTGWRIKERLRTVSLDTVLLKKKFFNMPL